MQQPAAAIRIVVAKPGLDGHDRGAKIVARALRDAGHEVIYTGLHQTPEQIVETAIQEDADLIGLSVLSGAHMTLFRKLIELLAERDASDIVVFGGGIIPEEDIPVLEEIGVAKVFTPGATTGEITGWVTEHFGAAAGCYQFAASVRQNGCPAGSSSTRHVSPGWSSGTVRAELDDSAPRPRRCRSPPGRSGTACCPCRSARPAARSPAPCPKPSATASGPREHRVLVLQRGTSQPSSSDQNGQPLTRGSAAVQGDHHRVGRPDTRRPPYQVVVCR